MFILAGLTSFFECEGCLDRLDSFIILFSLTTLIILFQRFSEIFWRRDCIIATGYRYPNPFGLSASVLLNKEPSSISRLNMASNGGIPPCLFNQQGLASLPGTFFTLGEYRSFGMPPLVLGSSSSPHLPRLSISLRAWKLIGFLASPFLGTSKWQ